jgi:hypothetical protein
VLSFRHWLCLTKSKAHFAFFVAASRARKHRIGGNGKIHRVAALRATELTKLLQSLFGFHGTSQKMCSVS